MLLGGNKESENYILNNVTLNSAVDIIQKFSGIDSYGTVAKDDVSVMTIEILKETTFKSGIANL